ncbi:Crp/Fnr family transcriptional regulator [Chelatococcus reniformis]|uniref:Transcriptional regulator n=1 Tax=Chelatococcus reniformis TaxID=1494448 RepID=A0A916UAC2_9HYPH|nr:Crp/Fnr family transcriptional regulator [Chelatococcus reniformis]GGC65256.1 transcriptional regulator [Chelatococcus reniformis]
MATDDIRSLLETDDWFHGLPEPLRGLIVQKAVLRDYGGDALVFATGDPPTGQFAVISGEIRLVSHTANGKHVLFSIFKPGMWFGHLSVLDQQPRFQDALTVGPTRLLLLSMAAFNGIIADEPRYILNFTHLLCRHIRSAMDMLAEMKTAPLSARLAHALLDMCADAAPPQLPGSRITQEELAAMMGASRQTINRLLRDWEDRDLIGLEYGRVIVRNRTVLSAVASHGNLPFS